MLWLPLCAVLARAALARSRSRGLDALDRSNGSDPSSVVAAGTGSGSGSVSVSGGGSGSSSSTGALTFFLLGDWGKGGADGTVMSGVRGGSGGGVQVDDEVGTAMRLLDGAGGGGGGGGGAGAGGGGGKQQQKLYQYALAQQVGECAPSAPRRARHPDRRSSTSRPVFPLSPPVH